MKNTEKNKKEIMHFLYEYFNLLFLIDENNFEVELYEEDTFYKFYEKNKNFSLEKIFSNFYFLLTYDLGLKKWTTLKTNSFSFTLVEETKIIENKKWFCPYYIVLEFFKNWNSENKTIIKLSWNYFFKEDNLVIDGIKEVNAIKDKKIVYKAVSNKDKEIEIFLKLLYEMKIVNINYLYNKICSTSKEKNKYKDLSEEICSKEKDFIEKWKALTKVSEIFNFLEDEFEYYLIEEFKQKNIYNRKNNTENNDEYHSIKIPYILWLEDIYINQDKPEEINYIFSISTEDKKNKYFIKVEVENYWDEWENVKEDIQVVEPILEEFIKYE